jgi:patatin-like phospholipase/acyl hydrolase
MSIVFNINISKIIHDIKHSNNSDIRFLDVLILAISSELQEFIILQHKFHNKEYTEEYIMNECYNTFKKESGICVTTLEEFLSRKLMRDKFIEKDKHKKNHVRQVYDEICEIIHY